MRHTQIFLNHTKIFQPKPVAEGHYANNSKPQIHLHTRIEHILVDFGNRNTVGHGNSYFDGYLEMTITEIINYTPWEPPLSI